MCVCVRSLGSEGTSGVNPKVNEERQGGMKDECLGSSLISPCRGRAFFKRANLIMIAKIAYLCNPQPSLCQQTRNIINRNQKPIKRLPAAVASWFCLLVPVALARV